MMEAAEAALAALDDDTDRLRLAQPADVAEPLAVLLDTEGDLERVVLLDRWARLWPAATLQALSVAADDFMASVSLGPTVARWLGSTSPYSLVLPGVDAVLITAWPTLQGAWRDAAAERPTVQRALGLDPERDTRPLTPIEPGWRWPTGLPFPPAATVGGAHARLTWLGHGCGPPTDAWNEAIERALERFQLDNFLEPTGELDEETIAALEDDTPEAP